MKHFLLLFTSACLCVCSLVQCSVNSNLSESKPVIGISTGFSGNTVKVNETYVAAVVKAGGIPIVLPIVRDDETSRALISRIDGLIMTGGEDINPTYYGETILNETVAVNGPRDTSDFMLMEAARNKGIPILGICRGEQEINVLYGGSLIQDITSQINSSICHRQSEPSHTGTHIIFLEKDSRLHKLLGVDSLMVNSSHHQAVKQLSTFFKVSAKASDGVIEAYESTDGRIICVQFHPESFIYHGNDTFLPIFQYLVQKSKHK